MLSKQRQEIDRIDREIVALFEARMAVVIDVARIKKTHNMPILDSSREALVYDKVTSYLSDAELSDKLKEVYNTLMKVSKDYQLECIQEE